MTRTAVSLVNEPAYYEALGRFIHAYSGVEVALFSSLRFYAKVTWRSAQALFPGIRVEQAMSDINRLCEVSSPGEERLAELKDMFAQLKAINKVRNSIVHYGTFVTDDAGRVTSNISRAHIQARIVERLASVEVLGQMTADLEKIGQHLVLQWALPHVSFAERARENEILTRPWRYNRDGALP